MNTMIMVLQEKLTAFVEKMDFNKADSITKSVSKDAVGHESSVFSINYGKEHLTFWYCDWGYCKDFTLMEASGTRTDDIDAAYPHGIPMQMEIFERLQRAYESKAGGSFDSGNVLLELS